MLDHQPPVQTGAVGELREGTVGVLFGFAVDDHRAVVLLRELHPAEKDPVGGIPYLLGHREMRPPDLSESHRFALCDVPRGILHALDEHLLRLVEPVGLGERYHENRIRPDSDVYLQVGGLPGLRREAVGYLEGPGEVLPSGDPDLLVRKGDQREAGPAQGLVLLESIHIASRRAHVDVVVVDRDLFTHVDRN